MADILCQNAISINIRVYIFLSKNAPSRERAGALV